MGQLRRWDVIVGGSFGSRQRQSCRHAARAVSLPPQERPPTPFCRKSILVRLGMDGANRKAGPPALSGNVKINRGLLYQIGP